MAYEANNALSVLFSGHGVRVFGERYFGETYVELALTGTCGCFSWACVYEVSQLMSSLGNTLKVPHRVFFISVGGQDSVTTK